MARPEQVHARLEAVTPKNHQEESLNRHASLVAITDSGAFCGHSGATHAPRLLHHSVRRQVVVETRHVAKENPKDLVRLVVSRYREVVVHLHQEADVVVIMLWTATARRNSMDVDIKDRVSDQANV